MTEDASLQIYDELVRERGGPDSLSVAQKVAARRLAHVLCTDDAFSASAVAALTAMLPAVAGPSAPGTLDLTTLTDEDFGVLCEVLSRAGALDDLSEENTIEATLAVAADRLAEMDQVLRRARVAEDTNCILHSRAVKAEEQLRLARLALTARDLTGLCGILEVAFSDIFNGDGAPEKARGVSNVSGATPPASDAENARTASAGAPRARPAFDEIGAHPPYAPNLFGGLVDERVGAGADRFSNRW